MMVFNRQKQRLLLEGKEYTPDDIRRCMVRGVENYPPAIWDLFLFLPGVVQRFPFTCGSYIRVYRYAEKINGT